MKKSRPVTPLDTSTSQDFASDCKRRGDLLGNWAELFALSGSKRAKEIEEERDRYWENTVIELWREDERTARPILYEAKDRLRETLALSGLPKSETGRGKLEAICRSSKKADKAKAPMARIALDAWAAFDAVEREIEKCKWSVALDSAIRLGCCIGRLQGKNEIGAARRGKGPVKELVRKAYQVWNGNSAMKRKHPRFDTHAARVCCEELRGSKFSSLGNMISALKAEERRRQDVAAFLRKYPLAEVE